MKAIAVKMGMEKMLWLTAVVMTVTACSSSPSDQSAATPATPASDVAFVAKGDLQGAKKEFSRIEMKQGAGLFKTQCSRCHVGGQTYGTYKVNEINLSLAQLKGATPPLDNIETLVAYMKKPLTYDGTQNLYDQGRHPKYSSDTGDRLDDTKLDLIAAHLLKEANFNPSWGKGKDVR